MSSTPRPVHGSSSSSLQHQQQHTSSSSSSSGGSSSTRAQPVITTTTTTTTTTPSSSRHHQASINNSTTTHQTPIFHPHPSTSAPTQPTTTHQATLNTPHAPFDAQSHPHPHLSTSLSQSLSNPSVLAHMARMQSHFSQLAPSCAAHLADQNAIPILSTAVPSSPALASLSAAFVHAHDTACRMGLGLPLRVTLNTGAGAAVIQTGTYPEQHHGGVGTDSEAEGDENDEDVLVRGMLQGGGREGEKMMLVGTVVAPRERLADARIASWGVEDMARKLQRCLSEGK